MGGRFSREREGGKAAVSNPSNNSKSPHQNEMTGDSIDGVDFISYLPDAILHRIFSFIPTKFAIRTSVLSKRWRHVWSKAPFLSIECPRKDCDSIIQTLTRYYSSPKIISFHLSMSVDVTTSTSRSQVDTFVEFAMSHNTEKLSLAFPDSSVDYKFPLGFYNNPSLKQLILDLGAFVTIPSVSWTSLTSLFLSFCELSDESFAKILSGSPLLESLTLLHCCKLEHLDLSKSLKLRRLDIEVQGPMQIVAPHIHFLRFKQDLNRTKQFQSDLVNVSSLTEADLNISCSDLDSFYCTNTNSTDLLIVVIMKVLEMLQNVEKLTLGATFLQILSLAEVCGDPFPILEVEVLNLETVIVESVTPGIAKLLENSPRLKKLKLHIDD